MPLRPTEAEFASDRGRIASPKRMNEFADFILQRFNALEGQRANWDAAVAELKEIGLSRVTEVLQPIYDAAAAIGADLQAMHDELASDAYRDALVDAVVQRIVDQSLFVRCGAGAEGITFYSGATPPDAADGKAGDLYAYVEPE